MTTPSKTIDDLGIGTYTRYENDKATFDERYISDAGHVALQLGTDVFEPLYISEYHLLFEIGTRGALWGMMPPPPKYNEQKKRLFTHQLAPKLGPEEVIEMQINRIDGKREQEKRKKRQRANIEESEENDDIDQEAEKLIQMMQDINLFNTIIAQVNAERYRYSKG